MNVLMVEPGKAPYVTDIGNDLRSMQQAVGGYIQAVYPYFTALASYITLGEQGRVVLHTKTETEVTLDDGSNESP